MKSGSAAARSRNENAKTIDATIASHQILDRVPGAGSSQERKSRAPRRF